MAAACLRELLRQNGQLALTTDQRRAPQTHERESRRVTHASLLRRRHHRLRHSSYEPSADSL